jgi:hypothetical protein
MAYGSVRDSEGAWLFDYDLPWVFGDGWDLDLAAADLSELPRAGVDRGDQLVAYLTPTYAPRRPDWILFARAQVAAQTHPRRVWIVADSSPDANAALADELGANYLHMPGTLLYDQRDALLAAARRVQADWFVWLDDDDLHDPRGVEALLAAWDGRSDWVSVTRFHVLNAYNGEIRTRKVATLLNNNCLFRTARCATIAHPQSLPEDGPWVMQVASSRRGQRLDVALMWLAVHGANSNSRYDTNFGHRDEHYEVFAWSDTEDLYSSRLCAFSSNDWEYFKQFMKKRHGVTVAEPTPTPPLRRAADAVAEMEAAILHDEVNDDE